MNKQDSKLRTYRIQQDNLSGAEIVGGNRKPLSKSEMEVVRIVWDEGEATVREVHELLLKKRKVDFTTVQTFLVRLEQKGYLKSKIVDRSKVFSPRVKASTVIGQAVEDFVSTLFGGEPLPLLKHMINRENLTAKQLAELKQLLDEVQADAASIDEQAP